ncbi:MAG: outer membrane beta-barrel protein [Bacteroidota bacterium]
MKNYFKIALFAFAISLCVNNLSAQGIYAKINAGYGLKMSSQNINYFHFINYTVDTVSSSYERVKTSLGKGFIFEGAVGYMFNKNIGAELGTSFHLGAKTKTEQTLYGSERNNCLSANMLRINPAVVISCGFDKINPYAKFGLIVGFGKIRYEDDYTSSAGMVVSEKMELNGGAAFGLSAGIGVTYNISKMLLWFGEINTATLSYAPTRGLLTESIFDGTDRLADITTSVKRIEFVDSYTTGLNYPYVDTAPRKELKESFPFGSAGICVGIKIVM